MIYKALIKYGYNSFELKILEYCDPVVLIKKEQHYLDLLNPEYNILKKAGSLVGFKHSEASRELMKKSHMGRVISEETKLKLATSSLKAQATIVINEATGEILTFTSTRKAAEYIGIHHSYISKSLDEVKFYLGKGFIVHKANISYSDIISSTAYGEALYSRESGIKHSEISKELIRKANLGRKHSTETLQKLSDNSTNSKAVLVTNNLNMETQEFPSISSAARHLSVDESYVRSCIKNNKPCKGHTIFRKSA